MSYVHSMGSQEDTPVRAHVTISGRVQGVYFRASAAEKARALGLSGWVRNAGDDVEAAFEGARPQVERMLGWCHEGPPRAHVDSVDLQWEEPEGSGSFGIRY
ncbi:MAG: acylphosphatase [Coriobacteriia bacterium]|nr:acylphosphatase [Coriobacteriia bacterium]